jgi:hypothetical protein
MASAIATTVASSATSIEIGSLEAISSETETEAFGAGLLEEAFGFCLDRVGGQIVAIECFVTRRSYLTKDNFAHERNLIRLPRHAAHLNTR